MASTAATALLTPPVISLARKLGAVDGGGYRKVHNKTMPRMGGLAVGIPFLLVCALVRFELIPLPGDMALTEAGRLDLSLMLVCGSIILGLGMVDDLRGLRASRKFAVQFLVALILCSYGKTITAIDIPMLGVLQLGPFLGMMFTIFWVVGIINAFNLVDGLDGLASGLAMIACLGMAAVAGLGGNALILFACLVLAGNLLGFLFHNHHPAKIFLGDTGSLFIGFALAMLTLAGASKTSGAVMMAVPIMLLGFPIFDTLSSMMRRVLRGHSPFQADRLHTHHRLLSYGYSHREAVWILYSVAAACAASAVLCQSLYPQKNIVLIPVALCGLVVMMLAWSNGYLRVRHFFRLYRCRIRNRRLAAFRNYAVLSLQSRQPSKLQAIIQTTREELSLVYLEVRHMTTNALIASSRSTQNTANKSFSMDRKQTMSIQTEDGQYLLLRYQHDHHHHPDDFKDENKREMDNLEHGDTRAFLGQFFGSMEFESLYMASYAAARQHVESGYPSLRPHREAAGIWDKSNAKKHYGWKRPKLVRLITAGLISPMGIDSAKEHKVQ